MCLVHTEPALTLVRVRAGGGRLVRPGRMKKMLMDNLRQCLCALLPYTCLNFSYYSQTLQISIRARSEYGNYIVHLCKYTIAQMWIPAYQGM